MCTLIDDSYMLVSDFWLTNVDGMAVQDVALGVLDGYVTQLSDKGEVCRQEPTTV